MAKGYRGDPYHVERKDITKSFCVRPRSMRSSHSGDLPFSVAKYTSNPAFWNSEYGTAVSEERVSGRFQQPTSLLILPVGSWP